MKAYIFDGENTNSANCLTRVSSATFLASTTFVRLITIINLSSLVSRCNSANISVLISSLKLQGYLRPLEVLKYFI